MLMLSKVKKHAIQKISLLKSIHIREYMIQNSRKIHIVSQF